MRHVKTLSKERVVAFSLLQPLTNLTIRPAMVPSMVELQLWKPNTTLKWTDTATGSGVGEEKTMTWKWG